jgi:hypothetical protein
MPAAQVATVLAIVLSALAPAPGKVELKTKSFGTVTLDHPAHLARKAACKACHGPGPVAKPEFTPKIAHERCVGCHRDGERGPTKCRECHNVPAAPIEPTEGRTTLAVDGAPGATTAVKQPASGALVASATGPNSGPAAPPGPIAGRPAATAPGPAAPSSMSEFASSPSEPPEFMRIVGVGYSMLNSGGGDVVTGPAFLLMAREERVLVVHTLERSVGATNGRTVGLVGAGLALPVYGRWSALAIALGGFDAPEKPEAKFLPAAALRVGAEWLGRKMCYTIAATGMSDLTRPTTALGEQIGGFTFSVSVTAGLVLDEAR